MKPAPNDALRTTAENIFEGHIPFFSSLTYPLGVNYDWVTNPDNGYRYDIGRHWTDINDFSSEAGDIKFVWEKSRFSYLYAVIRYDFHHGCDCSGFVIREILSWIDANPLNCGPNYKCSQEISLRILNWTFALYYYRNSDTLDERSFQKIINIIYWQLRHVYDNIDFSRIAVRNNHAITETLMLYLGGVLFPFFPESAKWKRDGKKWFEQEIEYQVYEDGTYLQFSHNYHRVVIQLMTWAFHLAAANGEKFSPVTYERAWKSLQFIFQCQNDKDGQLPNYGANDGALFFKLNDCDYRDFRPQLNALHRFLTGKKLYDTGPWHEDALWYGDRNIALPGIGDLQKDTTASFQAGGFYVLRDAGSMTFIRCGKHKDRPSHADNLHMDIWYEGENALRDAGTYKYNAPPNITRHFTGTLAHNTVSLGANDQMQKGPRFVWLHWSQAIFASTKETSEALEFSGQIRAFGHLGKNILHSRRIRKLKNRAVWEIEDRIENKGDFELCQHWHPSSGPHELTICAWDESGKEIVPQKTQGFYSGYYGQKEESPVISFVSKGEMIKTQISIK
jgi:hypothetical protein